MLKASLGSLFLILFLCATAGAQSKAASKARPRKTAPPAYPAYNYSPPPAEAPIAPQPPPTKRYYITALYSTASAIKYKGSADLYGVPTAFSATESTTGAF